MEGTNGRVPIPLGKVAITPKGIYQAGETYKILDLVEYDGGSYLCRKETKNAPLYAKTSEDWQCISIPGVATPDFIQMADAAVKAASLTREERLEVEKLLGEIINLAQEVGQNATTAAGAANEAERSRQAAAGYEQEADRHKQAAQTAEREAKAAVEGFGQTVEAGKKAAADYIDEARKTAVQAVGARQNEHLKAIDDEAAAATNTAKQQLTAATAEHVQELQTAGAAAKKEISDQETEQIQHITDAAAEELTKINNFLSNAGLSVVGGKLCAVYEG